MLTVPVAMTVPTGRSFGSLQVSAVSVARAAAFPLIFTDELPCFTVALLLGGLTKVPPIGMCDGVLVAVLPTTAAALPSIVTSALSSPARTPLKTWPGTATGDVGPGGWVMWVSTASTRSPFLAAGGMVSSPGG